ncbi:MAG: T9SS type A sorting domain-containing protein, partial [Candidatus Latescibacteria bacterium]|nr:T9SS type A sorting domain-containing protein [Candidatus Latescibacterota bacterium]
NPFNAETIIRYQLPAASAVRMTIYNLLGQEVRRLVDGNVKAGIHWMGWDGRDGAGKALASGMYFCRLQVGNFVQTRNMLILK